MSNVYRLAHVPDITYDVVDLPPDVRDADWLHRILQGGAEAVTVPDDWPILAAPDQSMSKLVRFSHDPGMALSCEFDPADNDEIVLALNNALQIDLHRRTGPPCTIQFFISGDVICAYVVAPHMAPEPPERTPSSLHDLLECTSQLLAPSGSSTSLSSSPSAGNVATPAGQHASTTPRSGSAAALTSPGPGARPISPGPPRPKVASRHVSSAFLFRKRSPAYGGITLPDQVASVKIPKYMARFVPHRIRYVREREYADCTPSPVKMDIDDVRAPVPDEGEAGGGSSSEQSNDESEMIDESDPHDEFELAAALPALLVLLQQHVHDPFFCRIVLGYTAESVPRQGRFRQHLSQRFLRQRCLALASISLPDWRLEAEPVPVMSLGSDSAVHPNQLSSIERVTIEDCEVLTGFDGDIRTLSPSAIAFWDEACLEPFKSRADISYVVVPDMTASRSEQSSLYQPFFEALSVMYETCMLGRHSAIKCIDDFMSMPTLFHGGSARQYYEFVMDQIGSPALRAKLSSTETSIVVLYLVVDKDDGLLSSLPWFSSVVNRLRLAFGSPTWDSSSRRKNVIAQVVPRGVIHERYDLVEDGRCSTLRQMAFSVFSRCHFVPAIPADARGQQSDQLLSNGLGLTALEPAFVVHARSDIPYPGHVAGHDQQQRSLLAVHVAYTVVGEYGCGCATDMRGERLQTSVSRGATLARGLESFWTACIRPILDFLHSRTDQGAMTLVVCRNGTRMPADEQSLWASLLASRLGGVWTSLNERDLRGRDDAPRDETIIARDVAAEDAAPADTRFLVSAAFLTSCAGSPALQPVDDPSEACFVMHRHWPMDAACGPRAIVHGNIYDGRTGIALQMSLEAYVVHSPANHQVVTCVTPAFVFDAFRAVLEQTAALTLFEPGEPPLHISTTHRLARLLAVALPDAADARQQQSSPSDGRPA